MQFYLPTLNDIIFRLLYSSRFIKREIRLMCRFCLPIPLSKARGPFLCRIAVQREPLLCLFEMWGGSFNSLRVAMNRILLKPNWPKEYYRAGVAWNILKKFDREADLFFEGLKLDPHNKELQKAYQEAVEARRYSSKQICDGGSARSVVLLGSCS